MDAIVRQAMARWPDVPSVYGWLGLDERGQWTIKGEPIRNAATVAFIGRNYARDARGRWFFQNGPQRVYVTLAYTPWIVRLASGGPTGAGAGPLETHVGVPVARVEGALLDETGAMVLALPVGPARVLDRDLPAMAAHLIDAAGRAAGEADVDRALALPPDSRTDLRLALAGSTLPVERVSRAGLAARFGYDPTPSAADGEEACA